MSDFNDIFKSVIKAGEEVGKSIDKRCPRCKGIMCPLKKYPSLDRYFWICDCGVSIPVDIG